MVKSAISVYNPQDPLERSLQDSCRKYLDYYMTSFECKLFCKAVESLKCLDGSWIYEEELYSNRADYFFASDMSSDEYVLPVNILYLRDILENKKVSGIIFNPAVFVTRPVAHFLLREYDVHLVFQFENLKSVNGGSVLKLGNLYIDNDGVNIPDKMEIVVNRPDLTDEVDKIVEGINSFPILKAASSESGDGVLFLDKVEKNLKINQKVMNKISKKYAVIVEVEPGYTGDVDILYTSGERIKVPKVRFEFDFVVI